MFNLVSDVGFEQLGRLLNWGIKRRNVSDATDTKPTP